MMGGERTKKRAVPSHKLSLYHWQGQVGSNHRVTESKSVALPLGYTPKIVKKMGRVVGLEPTHNGATIRRVSLFTTPATSGAI